MHVCLLDNAADNANSQKLMAEYEKYQELQARSQRLQEDYERQLLEMESKRKIAIEELSEIYENRLSDKNIRLEKAEEKLKQQQQEAEELQDQMESDTDQEILALKNRYERQLHLQIDENLKLRGDTGILRKKVTFCFPINDIPMTHLNTVCMAVHMCTGNGS